jgi:Domain of unknown function (DUF4336)
MTADNESGLLRGIATDLWAVEGRLRYFVEMGRRMTVVRLTGGDLFLHSPVPLTGPIRAAVDALGPVRFMVAASSLHGHLSMGDYQSAYPNVELLAPPGLTDKRQDLTFAGELGDRPDTRWQADLDQTVFRGLRLPEVVFLHRACRTLIVGDVCFNIQPGAPWLTRLCAWGPRMRPRPGPTQPFRLRGIRDRKSARASIQQILQWDFDRVIVGHGAVIETDGHRVFAAAWSWL